MRYSTLGIAILSLGSTAIPALAQITPNHAVVVTANPSAPRTVLLDVDLVLGTFTPLGRFTNDSRPPLGVAIDTVDRDVIVALDWPGGTRIQRVPLNGQTPGAVRVLADVPGKITDLEIGFGDAIFFTLDGATGGLFSIPRNGGTIRRVATLPRARGVFNFGQGTWSGFVLQAGTPATDPRIDVINYANGATVNMNPLIGYGRKDVTDLIVLPNAIQNRLVTHADGTIGEVLSNTLHQVLTMTPALPPGSTRKIRVWNNGTTPFVLGGAADPRLKSFRAFSTSPNRTWSFVTGRMPGDPIDFDIAPLAGPKAVRLGRACRPTGLHIATTPSIGPKIGNGAFELQLFSAVANSPALLAVGFSDDQVLGVPLPVQIGICSLYISADALIVTVTNGAGQATQPAGVPNDPSLAGRIVFVQWAQPRGGLVDTSAAVALHIER